MNCLSFLPLKCMVQFFLSMSVVLEFHVDSLAFFKVYTNASLSGNICLFWHVSILDVHVNVDIPYLCSYGVVNKLSCHSPSLHIALLLQEQISHPSLDNKLELALYPVQLYITSSSCLLHIMFCFATEQPSTLMLSCLVHIIVKI